MRYGRAFLRDFYVDHMKTDCMLTTFSQPYCTPLNINTIGNERFYMYIQNTFESIFSFLGDRKYVHGSDMVYALLDIIEQRDLGNIDRIIASYHSPLNEQGRYVFFQDPLAKNLIDKGYCSTFNIYFGEKMCMVGLKGNGKPVTDSSPYDEERLIASSNIIIDQNSASILCSIEKSILNVLIALNKKMLLAVLPTKGFGRWFSSRLDLKWQLMNSFGNKLLEVKLIGNIQGLATKSLIKINGHSVGSIYFVREQL